MGILKLKLTILYLAGDMCSVRVSKGVLFLQVCVNSPLCPFPFYSSR